MAHTRLDLRSLLGALRNKVCEAQSKNTMVGSQNHGNFWVLGNYCPWSLEYPTRDQSFDHLSTCSAMPLSSEPALLCCICRMRLPSSDINM